MEPDVTEPGMKEPEMTDPRNAEPGEVCEVGDPSTATPGTADPGVGSSTTADADAAPGSEPPAAGEVPVTPLSPPSPDVPGATAASGAPARSSVPTGSTWPAEPQGGPAFAASPDSAATPEVAATPAPAARAVDAAAPGGDGMLVLGAPATPAPAPPPPPPVPQGPPCTDCGGQFGADGYCEQCGARRPNPRHHYERVAPDSAGTTQASPQRDAATQATAHVAPDAGAAGTTDAAPAWVGGVCDRGIRHVSNEDALALYAEGGSPRRAALVVCDGVSTARRSSRASQAAADAALGVLASTRSRGLAGVASALVGALGSRLDAATDAAVEAVLDVTHGPETDEDREDTGIVHLSDPACTFVAAVIDGNTAVVGSVGDSRGYWLPDDHAAQLLTRDDSWSEEQIALGVPREVAEAAPQAHSITRWLGTDAPDHTPAKTTLEFDAPGWLLLCSDGLWNYASEPAAIRRVVDEIAPTLGANPPPVALARRLVEWANAQGGRDNITVALARIDAPPADSGPATSLDVPAHAGSAPDQIPAEQTSAPSTPQEGQR